MRILKKFVHWLLFIVSAILIISGFGITEFRIVEKLTFGLLDKSLAFKIHSWLAVPFIVILFFHLYVVGRRKR